MKRQELTCIGCPMGCQITVEMENGAVVSITGHSCPRGDKYARQECTAPERVVTSLMVADFAHTPVSVKTAKPIPKAKIAACLAQIHATTVQLPVREGDVMIPDVCGTGVPVVATRDVM